MPVIAIFLSQICAKFPLKFSLEFPFGQVFNFIKLSGIFAVMSLSLGACGQPSSQIISNANLSAINSTQTSKITISEVSPPPAIQKLSRYFDVFAPQIKIVEPKSDQILSATKVVVKLEVQDLPIFKDPRLGLGAHIHVILDNQEYKALYDLTQPLVFENLAPGTHTIRAFASRPWHESFKNEGAFAQSTFHVYTKTGENTPNPQLPLLTYSRPVGEYGAEPIMLDFYLKNTPLHAALLEQDPTTDWQIRVTVNNQSFAVDQWLPVYIKGLNPGLNWVKLEFLDAEGHLVANQFNSTAHLINYQPNGTDTLSRLVRGEEIEGIEGIVNPNFDSSNLKIAPKIQPKLAPAEKAVKEENPEKSEKLIAIPKPDQKSTIEPLTDNSQENNSKPNNPKINNSEEKNQEKPEIKPEKTELIPAPIAPAKTQAPAKLSAPIPKITPANIIPKNPEPIPAVNKNAELNIKSNSNSNSILEKPQLQPKPESPKPESSKLPESEPAKKTKKVDLPKTSNSKVLTGLEHLNFGEKLKQARAKKSSPPENSAENAAENSAAPTNPKTDLKLEIKPKSELKPESKVN